MKYSILKYGSHVRGNSDKYSDKDLLIVTENYDDIEYLKELYPATEWSISHYTYEKLRYLSGKGYLFIKHLINEGFIEKDNDNKLYEILNSYNESLNYHDEIQKTKEFFDFVSVIPNNSVSLGWLCDNIYVNFRNFMIYNSALKKAYKFSYIGMIDDLRTEGTINDLEKTILENLRVLKSCYRNEIVEIRPDINYISDLLNIMKKFNININIHFSESQDIFRNYNLYSINSSYKKLRIIELIYHNLGIENKMMIKYITHPQMYANSKSIKRVISKLLESTILKNNDILLKNGIMLFKIPSN